MKVGILCDQGFRMVEKERPQHLSLNILHKTLLECISLAFLLSKWHTLSIAHIRAVRLEMKWKEPLSPSAQVCFQ